MTSRVAIVTGSNKGIGYGIVRNLLKYPFDGDVYLTSRDVQRGLDAVKQLKEEIGIESKYHQLDIDDEDSIIKLRDFLASNYNGLDVLVNNAAIAYANDSTAPVSEQAENTLKTNYFSTKSACQILFPILKPHARVVNVSSSAGMLQRIPDESLRKTFSDPNLTEEQLDSLANKFIQDTKNGNHIENGWGNSTYVVSKVALSALTFIQQRKFDKDEREDIVVNAVHPGFVDTDMTNHKGILTIEQGADAPSYLALLPKNVKEPRGQMIWYDRKIVNWYND